MKKKIIKIFFLILLFGVYVSAQNSIQDYTLTEDFRCQVKSLEEFQMRFNGLESKPGVKSDSLSRRNNIISLFNFKMNKGNLTKEQFDNKINTFVDSVLLNNIDFNITNAGLWAECKTKVKYKDTNKIITLIMQSEKTDKELYRWAIIGVKGLEESGIINSRFYTISPVEHEVHFMGLYDFINENPSHAYGYRSRNAKIDELSVFLTLVSTGSIKFDGILEQIYHYVDIPGFVFSIKEIVREGSNSGWLISAFDQVTSNEKIKYVNKLFGYE